MNRLRLWRRSLKGNGGGAEQDSVSAPDAADHPVLLQGGITASRGVGSGPVHLLRREVDNLSFASGDVMVVSQSLPGYAVLLDRAAAVIAEYGSISSHLATVAREYGVPVIFGVKGAMDLLEDGRVVTVDADGMKIYDGKVSRLLRKKTKPRHLMADTPVYNILRQVIPHVSPLTLLNPDSPGFHRKTVGAFMTSSDIVMKKRFRKCFGSAANTNSRSAPASSSSPMCPCSGGF
jgi:pyruvate, water dikinase